MNLDAISSTCENNPKALLNNEHLISALRRHYRTSVDEYDSENETVDVTCEISEFVDDKNDNLKNIRVNNSQNEKDSFSPINNTNYYISKICKNKSKRDFSDKFSETDNIKNRISNCKSKTFLIDSILGNNLNNRQDDTSPEEYQGLEDTGDEYNGMDLI